MAPGSKFKNSEMILPCEWEECLFVGKRMEEFCDHVAGHLKEYLQHPLETAEHYRCWWRNCEFGAKDPRELITHVNFHSYHAKLKFVGSRLRALHRDLPACLLTSRSWHQLPQTSEEFVCNWENCNVTFNNPEWFYQHVAHHAYATEEKTVTDQKKAVYCHWKVNRVTCPLCDAVCTSVSSLKAHTRYRHCDERPFRCHLCDSSFKNAYDLHKHVETHNDSDAYSCDVEGCGFTSRTLQTLKQHYKRAHVSNGILRYKCHICQKCFCWSYSLTLHLRKAHNLSSHSRFRYKEDDEGHMSLNLAVFNAVTGLGQTLNNKMIINKSPVSQNSLGREGGDSCERETSTTEILFMQLQPWSQATGENVLVEADSSILEPVYSELQTAVQTFESCSTSSRADEATPVNVKEKLIEIDLGLGIQMAF
ncbi:histone H4 transcription factor-like isoform X4 [Anas acuta]|uniref:histone H4 transcription factor-like isoform X4 n=1 Tax=Anas acuta TaxID=28680 RepID=UPI0035C8FC76